MFRSVRRRLCYSFVALCMVGVFYSTATPIPAHADAYPCVAQDIRDWSYSYPYAPAGANVTLTTHLYEFLEFDYQLGFSTVYSPSQGINYSGPGLFAGKVTVSHSGTCDPGSAALYLYDPTCSLRHKITKRQTIASKEPIRRETYTESTGVIASNTSE